MAEETWYTCEQMAAKLLPGSSEWARTHVAVALGELTRWYVEHDDLAPIIDRNALAKEVREMNMAPESRDRIIADLELLDFQCQWILYAPFEVEAAGFVLQMTSNALT